MTILTILVLVGAFQGLVSGAVFLARSQRWLAWMLIFLSMALINLVLMDAGVRYLSPIANLIAYVLPLLLVMPVGPLLYHYVQSTLDPGCKTTRSVRLHFYASIIDLLPYMAGVILVIGMLAGFNINESAWRYVIDEYNAYVDIIRWMSLSVYVVLAMKVVKDYSHTANEETVKWLRQITIAFATFQLIWLLHLLPYLLPAFRNDFIQLVTWYPIYIPLSIMIYWLSIHGYLRMSVSVNRKTSLPSEVIEETDRVLNRAMERDRLYLDPNMTVLKLSGATGISSKTISAFLNQHRGISFNQFINAYRVEELKRRLKSPGDQHFTISGLGMECGFNSPATMQRAFREVVRCSPRQYQLKNP